MTPYDVLSVKPIIFSIFSHVYYFETEIIWGKIRKIGNKGDEL